MVRSGTSAVIVSAIPCIFSIFVLVGARRPGSIGGSGNNISDLPTRDEEIPITFGTMGGFASETGLLRTDREDSHGQLIGFCDPEEMIGKFPKRSDWGNISPSWPADLFYGFRLRVHFRMVIPEPGCLQTIGHTD